MGLPHGHVEAAPQVPKPAVEVGFREFSAPSTPESRDVSRRVVSSNSMVDTHVGRDAADSPPAGDSSARASSLGSPGARHLSALGLRQQDAAPLPVAASWPRGSRALVAAGHREPPAGAHV